MDLFYKGTVIGVLGIGSSFYERVRYNEYVVNGIIDGCVDITYYSLANKTISKTGDKWLSVEELTEGYFKGRFSIVSHPIPENKEKLVAMLNSPDIDTRELAIGIIKEYKL